MALQHMMRLAAGAKQAAKGPAIPVTPEMELHKRMLIQSITEVLSTKGQESNFLSMISPMLQGIKPPSVLPMVNDFRDIIERFDINLAKELEKETNPALL